MKTLIHFSGLSDWTGLETGLSDHSHPVPFKFHCTNICGPGWPLRAHVVQSTWEINIPEENLFWHSRTLGCFGFISFPLLNFLAFRAIPSTSGLSELEDSLIGYSFLMLKHVLCFPQLICLLKIPHRDPSLSFMSRDSPGRTMASGS